MTAEELKEKYSMRDILCMCGLPQPNRSGFIQCPFHHGDREPSMKIYKRDYNCFACGANGDIFTFAEEYYGMSFKEAFLFLGGTYEKETYKNKLSRYHAEKERDMKRKAEEKLKARRNLNNLLIGVYQKWYLRSEPFSDTWTDCYNALQYQLYLHEILNDAEGGDSVRI